MSDRQCSSCGGFCGRGGCKRENVKVNKQREAMQFALETLEDIFGKKKIDVTAINMLREALYEPARKPLSDERLDQIIASNVTITDRNLYGAVYMAIREVEQEHGIGSD